MRVVGLMSGTSYDGIDVAIADLSYDAESQAVRLAPVGAREYPHSAEIASLIARVLPPASISIEDVCRLDALLGRAFGEAAALGIAELAGGTADLVVSHGQTVFHWIEDGRAQGSLQLGQPAWIAERTGLPVVSDLRNRDIAKGGQGAPLVPIFDVLLLPPADSPRAALNLGGIANMTVISPSGGVLAYDLGPANALIDAAASLLLGQPYDGDGVHASSGTVHGELLERLLAEPYYERTPPKSTGKELFNSAYLTHMLSAVDDLASDDVLATVTETTVRVVANELTRHGVADVVVSGGGIRNTFLMRRLGRLLDGTVKVRQIDDFGIPSGAKEAYAFALLGYLTVHGVPGTIPGCTGAEAPSLLGSVTPGAYSLRIPRPFTTAPRALVVETREDRGHDR